MTRQIEKYADIYTSRVSNFFRYTPYTYFRSPGQSLPHALDLSDYYAQLAASQQGELREPTIEASTTSSDHASTSSNDPEAVEASVMSNNDAQKP